MLIHKFKQKLFNKNTLYKLLAFFIPIFSIVLVVIIKQFTQGNYFNRGENFLVADMMRQYVSIFSHIWDAFRGNGFLFYTFNNGLGGNMASTIGYYAASPLNILYLLGSKTDIPLMTFIIYLIKTGLTGFFMNVFLNYKFGRKSMNIMFSTMYALSAYTVNYYFHTMWLDVVALTPLVILGINKMIEGKSIKLYVISLSLAIISNFYTAYMLCIFCVIYFVYTLWFENTINNKLKLFRKFILCSLLAFGISCWLLLPIIYNLQTVRRIPINILKMNSSFISIIRNINIKFIPRLYIGSYSREMIMELYPSIYAGMLLVVLLFFYFCNVFVKIKEKIFVLLIISFFVFSTYIPLLNMFWHGGTLPNGYMMRYSFLMIFFVIYIAAKSYYKLKSIELRHFILFFVFYIILILLTINSQLRFRGLHTINIYSIVLSSVFIFIYLLLLFFINKKKMIKIFIIVLVLIELTINYYMCIVTRKEWDISGNYIRFYQKYCSQINDLNEEFYRMASDYSYGNVDSMICQNRNFTISLSTTNKQTYNFLKNNGGHTTYLDIWYDSNKLPIIDSILGIKYIVGRGKWKDSYYKKIREISNLSTDKNDKYYLYNNSYALSLGYLIPYNYKKIYSKEEVNDSIDSINRFMKTLSGNEKDVLIKYPMLYKPNNKYYSNYVFDINNDEKNIYFNFKYDTSNYMYKGISVAKIYVNGDYLTDSTVGDLTAIKIKNKYKNKKIMVKVVNDVKSNSPADSLNIYYFDEKVFDNDIKKIKKHQLKNIKISGNKLTGNINVKQKSVLFTSIPYEKGWQVYVDGKKTNYEKIADEFIGVRLNKGTHKIKMFFYPPWLFTGGIISSISIIILIVYEIRNGGNYEKNKKK